MEEELPEYWLVGSLSTQSSGSTNQNNRITTFPLSTTFFMPKLSLPNETIHRVHCTHCRNKVPPKENRWPDFFSDPSANPDSARKPPETHWPQLHPNRQTSTQSIHGIGPSGFPNVYAPPSIPIRKPLKRLTYHAAPVYLSTDDSIQEPGTPACDWLSRLREGKDETWRGALTNSVASRMTVEPEMRRIDI